MDTTYQEMIMSVGSAPCQNNEFIELNKMEMSFVNSDE